MKVISAGGVVYRKNGTALEIQLIRDRFGKMTLAKGKMEPGETVEETALREIAEETGIIGRIIKPLSIVSYVDHVNGPEPIDKEAHYYLVEATGGVMKAQIEEIDGVGWYPPMEALKLQQESGYGNNDGVVQQALTELGIHS
ncbi:NUDIX hydrolase [Gorillibacterium massiliense]|uniref:NUDIX hydrolase n=1 Tax=Gorillibacterium massiliense TaxID=1280390 RepID=UPI0004B69858|nr:NUDIX domain-containing protein [Gorillibacterium massiliense]